LGRQARAQDPFEIEVYPYETAHRGEWELGMHLNYTARGTRDFDGSVAPTDDQAHFTLELTHGFTNFLEFAAYGLTAYRPGHGFDAAGWRFRTRTRVPESLGWPVNVGLAVELEFTRATYDETTAGLEIRPILDKTFGRVQLTFNPTIERGLRGAEKEWEFEPAGRVGVTLSERFAFGLEYYGKTGLFGDPAPGAVAVHQFFPGIDWKLSEDATLNVGVGFGTTTAGDRLILKTRFEVPLGE
jgi:hypothetical protein